MILRYFYLETRDISLADLRHRVHTMLLQVHPDKVSEIRCNHQECIKLATI